MLATDVEAEVGRFRTRREAAVYFCCLEAMQNAGKHAGEGARITVTVASRRARAALRRSPTTAPASTRPATRCAGHGFVNMADRLGAIGGTLTVESAPGEGTTISGEIPLDRRASTRRLTSGDQCALASQSSRTSAGTEVFFVHVRERADLAGVGGRSASE